MAVSRQTVANRTKSVVHLQAIVPAGCSLTVRYDETRSRFVIEVDGRLHWAGRYEVVWAYLRGYADGVALAELGGWTPPGGA